MADEQTVPQSPSGRPFSAIQQDISNGVLSLQSPADFLINLIYWIPALAPIRICIELDIFHRLAEASSQGKSVTADGLTESLPINPNVRLDMSTASIERRDYIVRLLRLVTAVGLIDEAEIEPFTYQANALTHSLADPGMAAGFLLVFDNVMGPKSTISSLLPYSIENSFRAPSTAEDGPFQRARDIVGTSTFQFWVAEEPKQLSRLNSFMQRVQKDRPHWTEWFSEDALFGRDDEKEVPDFVDVGGGLGHDIFALASKYPEKKIRFVLQDLPSVIEEGKTLRASKSEELDVRIEQSSHDFFETQPIEKASIYFMHKIMHDWPDNDCARILSRLRDAMELDSRIFVNEVIVPAKGASLLQAGFDITMLALHSGQERDEEMWQRLVSKVEGLSIRKFWQPPGGQGEGIVEIVRSG